MKRLLPLLVALGAVACAQEFKLGAKVSELTVQDLNGRPVAFSPLNAVTVVTFISTQCPVSNAYDDRMSALYKDYSAKGVKFIFVNANRTESPAEVQEHARAVGFAFPVYKDANNRLADQFGAQATPETFVIDQAGIVRYHGALDDSQNPARVQKRTLQMALDAVLSGSPVVIQETRAFGCTIKRVRKTAALRPLDEAGFQKLVAAHHGKVVVYDFWATYCEPCRAEMPQLIALQAKLKTRGFELVTISADEPEQETAAAKVMKQFGSPSSAYRKQARNDDRFISAIDPQWSGALPALFIYDRAGRKARSFIGETEIATIEAAIQKLL